MSAPFLPRGSPGRASRMNWGAGKRSLRQSGPPSHRQSLASSLGTQSPRCRAAQLLRLWVTQATLHADDDGVSFTVAGTRFRRDGTLGKRYDTFYLRFEDEKPGAAG
jgi:hypothetical protein